MEQVWLDGSKNDTVSCPDRCFITVLQILVQETRVV